MNGVGLCGAWEVLILRPMESLLLLQQDCMIKCHHSHHPLAPTYCFLSVSHCYSSSGPCCLCYLVLSFTSLSIFIFTFAVCPYFSLSLCSFLSLSPSQLLYQTPFFYLSYTFVSYSQLYFFYSFTLTDHINVIFTACASLIFRLEVCQLSVYWL